MKLTGAFPYTKKSTWRKFLIYILPTIKHTYNDFESSINIALRKQSHHQNVQKFMKAFISELES